MSIDNDPWPYYADLQQCSMTASRISNYAWGVERALDSLLDSIESGTIPSNPHDLEDLLNRAIASGGRRHRSRQHALKRVPPLKPVFPDAALHAKLELTKLGSAVNPADLEILLDAGIGYTDREIVARHGSTAGAIRVRLSRLRLKLEA